MLCTYQGLHIIKKKAGPSSSQIIVSSITLVWELAVPPQSDSKSILSAALDDKGWVKVSTFSMQNIPIRERKSSPHLCTARATRGLGSVMTEDGEISSPSGGKTSLGQMPYGPTDIGKCSSFSFLLFSLSLSFFHTALSSLALKCYIHFPEEATGKWTVANAVYFWNEHPPVLENGLGLEKSLIFLKELISPLNKGVENIMAVVNNN